MAIPSVSQAQRPALRRRTLLLLWLLAGLSLLAASGHAPVRREQEGRVLETARQMLGSGWHGWMTPHLNGQPRLLKPPLNYWLSACAYQIGGVSEWAGRAPTVVMSWLTLGVTFAAARWLFGQRAGLLSAGMLLTSYLFFRHSLLAETDVPAMLFVTLAIYGLWRGSGLDPRQPRPSLWWTYAGALGIALTAMSKGAPFAFPVAFLVLMALFGRRWISPRLLVAGGARVRAWRVFVRSRQWGPLWWFVRSGAALLFLVVAAPWFVYSLFGEGGWQFARAVDVLKRGSGHSGPFYNYFLWLLMGTAPWCGVAVMALIDAMRRWGSDWRVRGVLLWAAATLLPLFVVGNKQVHYLLPMMPPVMILAGWLVDRALWQMSDAQMTRHFKVVLAATMLTLLLAGPGIVVASWLEVPRLRVGDVALGVVLGVISVAVLAIYRRRGPRVGMVASLAGLAVAMPLLLGVWAATIEDNSRQVASLLRARFGDGPYCFYGASSPSSPLCFSMRAVIPGYGVEAELVEALRREPRLVVIVHERPDKPVSPPPPPLMRAMEIQKEENRLAIYAAQ